jgi:hypothetical protein
MKSKYLLLAAILISLSLSAQNLEWKAGVYNFFDNTEFSKSSYAVAQTMAGVRFSPEIGLSVDSVHHLRFGIDMLKEYGSQHYQDGYTTTAYYFYDCKPFKFYMGSFPRLGLLDAMPRALFCDSIGYYRPNMTGFLWWYQKKQFDAKVFLDWTGKQTLSDHEAFFMGGMFLYRRSIYFAELQTYMFHYAGSIEVRGVRDNGMLHAAIGLDLTSLTKLDTLSFRLGFLGGQERLRKETLSWNIRNGILAELQIGYKRMGLKSSTYIGQGLMSDYSSMGSSLYWGDPLYRGTFYNRSDLFYDFFKSPFASARLTLSQHFSENQCFFEQSLIVRIALDHNSKKSLHQSFNGKE